MTISSQDIIKMINNNNQNSPLSICGQEAAHLEKMEADLDILDCGCGTDISEADKESPLNAFFIREKIAEELGDYFLDAPISEGVISTGKIRKLFASWNKIKVKGKVVHLVFCLKDVFTKIDTTSDVARIVLSKRKINLPYTEGSSKKFVKVDLNFGFILE